MVAPATLALAGTAVLVLSGSARAGPLVRLHGRPTTATRPGRRPDLGEGSQVARNESARRRTPGVLGVAVGVAMMLLVGMPAGVPVGIAAGGGTWWWAARGSTGHCRQVEQARRAELPAVLDLLAVCLSTGLPLAAALELVATALPGELSGDLHTVAALHRLGAAPAVAWNGVHTDPVLGPVARSAIRSGESGSALAMAFERLALEHRADDALRCEAQARRAGVLAMAPLGLCFLPAFVCLGVVPVVLGIAHQVLGATVTGSGGPG